MAIWLVWPLHGHGKDLEALGPLLTHLWGMLKQLCAWGWGLLLLIGVTRVEQKNLVDTHFSATVGAWMSMLQVICSPSMLQTFEVVSVGENLSSRATCATTMLVISALQSCQEIQRKPHVLQTNHQLQRASLSLGDLDALAAEFAASNG